MTSVFSATLPDDVENLSRKYMKNPIKGPLVLRAMKTTTIKGKLLKVHKAR